MIEHRVNTFNENYCWQYDIRLKNLQTDLCEANLTESFVKTLRIKDFKFKNVVDKTEKNKLKEFIVKHEWLGNLSQYTTHWFGCYYNGILAGVILFNMPNAFSKMLGDNTKDLERLISRGACISWSPKNLASSFMMWCVKWMVNNTQYRLFTAYSDPIAKELGTIYQACNFYYLGQKSGATVRYINPYTGKIVSDRFFRQKTAYRKYANELNIEWCKNWSHNTGMNWHNIPDEIEVQLREYSKLKQKNAVKVDVLPKHKYAMVLGRTNMETKHLRRLFKQKNKINEYPTNRGK